MTRVYLSQAFEKVESAAKKIIAAVADGDGDFASRDQADARDLAVQLAQAIEQVCGSFVVRPIVAGVVDFNGKTGASGSDSGLWVGDIQRDAFGRRS